MGDAEATVAVVLYSSRIIYAPPEGDCVCNQDVSCACPSHFCKFNLLVILEY
jgi:hypothetical protein